MGWGSCAPSPHYAPPVSNTYLYMLLVNFTNIIIVPVCVVGKCPCVIDWSCSRWRHVTPWRHNSDVMIFNVKCFFSGNVPLCGIVLTYSWSWLWRHWWRHHVIIFVATLGLISPYLGNEARWRNGSNEQPIEKCPWAWSFGHAPDDVTWPNDVIMVTSSFFCKVLLLRRCSPIWYVCMSSSLVYPTLWRHCSEQT